MLLNTKEQLLDWFDSHNSKGKEKPYLYVYANKQDATSGRGKTFYHSSENTGLAASASREELVLFLEKLTVHNTKYLIRLRSSPEQSKDQAETEYVHIDENMKALSQSHVSGFGSITAEKLEERILQAKAESRAELLAELERKKEIDDLKATVKELKEADNDFSNKISKFFDNPTIQGIGLAIVEKLNITPKVMGNTAQLTQVASTEVYEEIDENAQNQFESAIEDLKNADPDFIDSLSKLAKLAKENPTKYNLAKSML